MNNDPNVTKVEMAAAELGPLLDELVLVGGCAVGLLITDPASPPVRPTIDVDVIVEIAPVTAYYGFCEKLKTRGFSESSTDGVICRWSKAPLVIDVMPIDEKILGFTNSWYTAAIRSAAKHTLRNGLEIRLISAPAFIATKLESFHGRGGGDYLHHDIEDIVNLINGRESICDEVAAADSDVKAFLMDEFDSLLSDATFVEIITWHLHPTDQATRLEVVLGRMRTIAGM
jgi:hypothetical protein